MTPPNPCHALIRAGMALAEWVAKGEPPYDLWPVDIRRFGPFMANRRALAERTGETLGLHYAMRWPRQRTSAERDCPAARSTSSTSRRTRPARFTSVAPAGQP